MLCAKAQVEYQLESYCYGNTEIASPISVSTARPKVARICSMQYRVCGPARAQSPETTTVALMLRLPGEKSTPHLELQYTINARKQCLSSKYGTRHIF